MGRITDLARGFPGYSGRIPKSCGFLSEILRDTGYATYAVGKWHLTPEHEAHLAAPRTRWPLGRGFERFYGFFGGETHQFSPALVHDNHFVEAPPTVQSGDGLPPHRGPRRSRDRVPERPARRRPRRSRSSSTSRPARATRRTSRPRTGGSATAASSMPAGTPGARRRSPARSRPA